MSKEIVLIGDIIRSKTKQDRSALQERLKNEIKKVNREFRSEIKAPLKLTKGDEFEGVFKNIRGAVEAFEKIESEIYPDKIRGGIGVGEITTKNTQNVSEMDGPAFYRAREMIEEGKKSNRSSSILLIGGGEGMENSVNVILRLLMDLKSEWTKREREIMDYWIFEGYPTQEEVAERFGIDRSTVAQHLSNAHHGTVRRSRKFIFNLLENV